MLAIIVGLLAGLAGLLMAPLAMAIMALVTAAMAALSPVLSLYRSLAGMAVVGETARGSASTVTRSDRDAEVTKLSEGRRDAEESRLCIRSKVRTIGFGRSVEARGARYAPIVV